MMLNIEGRVRLVQERIKRAALASGRDPDTVRLVAVAKAVDAARVREAVKAGVTIVGENYVQEAKEKIEALRPEMVSWHFIGHLQSNKAKYAVRLFDLIHSVDSLGLAEELNRRAGAIGKVQEVLIQVNISGEETKSGINVQHALDLVRGISRLENLSVRGLMTMPPFFDVADKVRPYFRALRSLRDRIRDEAIPNVHVTELSMGMSGDFEAAIEEGATMVRIGTAIFGQRP